MDQLDQRERSEEKEEGHEDQGAQTTHAGHDHQVGVAECSRELLADEDFGTLVVYELAGVAGVISERDIVRAPIADGGDLDATEVCEYMTEAAIVSEEDAAIGDAIAKMNQSGVRHVVVVSGQDVSGMISMRDVVALLGTDWPEL